MNCTNCGSGRVARRGRCWGCYQFWRRNGRDSRPAERRRREGDPVAWCRRCRIAPVRRRGLCQSCVWYQDRAGRARPRHLWAEHCLNCRRPRHEGDNFGGGRCGACRWYLAAHGEERPQELIAQAAPLGWCDCGSCAVATVEATVGGWATRRGGRTRTTTLLLCADCVVHEELHA